MRRNEAFWAVGISTSLFGDSALAIAFAVWLKNLTGSTAQAGLAFFTFFAPTLLAPLSGLVADLVRRVRLLIAADAAQALWICLGFLVHGAGQAWIVYLVLVGVGLGSDLEATAASALLGDVIPAERRARVNSVFRAAKDLALLAAPAAGVAIYSAAGIHAVIAVDLATYLVSAVSVLRLGSSERPPERSHEPLAAQLSAGIRHIATTPRLRNVIIAVAACLLAFGMFEPLSIQITTAGLRRPATFVGALLSVKSFGSVLGGLLCARFADRVRADVLVSIGMGLMGAGTLLLLAPQWAVVAAGCLVVGAGASTALIGFLTVVQLGTPANLQGRVFSAADAAIRVPQATAMAVGAGLAATEPYRALLGVMAAVTLLSAGTLAKVQIRRSAPVQAEQPAVPSIGQG